MTSPPTPPALDSHGACDAAARWNAAHPVGADHPDAQWDGHTTAQKYERVRAAARSRTEPSPAMRDALRGMAPYPTKPATT